MSATRSAPILAVVLGALLACAEEPGAGEEPRADVRSGGPASPARAVLRLVDDWPQVRAAESSALELPELLPLDVVDPETLPAGEGWVYARQAWDARDQRVRTGEGWCDASAEAAAERAPCYLPALRRFGAAELESDGELRPRLQDRPETWNLAPGEQVHAPMEFPASGSIEIVARALRGQEAELEVEVGGRSIGRMSLAGPGWQRRSLPGEWPAGRHEVRVLVRGEGRLRVAQLASLGRELSGPDHVLWPAERPARWSYSPRPPRALEWLPVRAEGMQRRASVLALGGELRLQLPEGAEEARVGGRPSPGGAGFRPEPGLVEIEWRGGDAERLAVHQPCARVHELIADPEGELVEDLAAEVEGGELPGTLLPLFLRRLECAHDRRVALLLPAPASLDWSVELQAGDRLRFSTGRPQGSETPVPEEVELRLRWSPEGAAPREVHAARVASGSGWSDHEWRVPEGAGGRGMLRFETEGPVDALAAFADPRIVRASSPTRAPNLILYVIDTLRADGLSCYGNPNATTPELDAIAARSLRFERCYSVSSWTRPAIGTMMTGLYPPYHGILSSLRPLPQDLVTLAEVLSSAGYGTGAVVSNVQVDARGVHFEQGFHRFLTTRGLGIERPEFHDTPSSRRIGEVARDWLRAQEDEPFFLYLHSMDPHMPYLPPEETRRRFDPDYDGPLADLALTDASVLWSRIDQLGPRDFEFVRNVYDAEIRSQDEQIGALWRWLESSGRLDDTIVAFVSDHGEEFYEHGNFSHQGRMWELHLRVPWILYVPPGLREEGWSAPRIVEQPVSLVDLLPTLLGTMGVEDPVPRQGRNLADAGWGPVGGEAASFVYAQESRGLSTLLEGPWKLIRRERNGELELQLYHLEDDPGEQHDLATERPQVLRRMLDRWTRAQEELDAGPHPSRRDSAERVQFRGEDAERMRALGYSLDEDESAPSGPDGGGGR